MLIQHQGMMNLWLNLRRSLSKQSKKIKVNSAEKEVTVPEIKEKQEILIFPYGSKEMVVYKEQGNQN